MNVLCALTYYRPHVSGLTIYVRRLAGALARRGHRVTVLTSGYDRRLPPTEIVDGVRVVRVPVLWRVSKGVIMPTFSRYAYRLMGEHDVVSVHLPQFESGLLAFMGRFIVHKPVVLTYHCDLQLPPGLFNGLVDRVVMVTNHLAGVWADRIVAYTQDYADHSPFLSRFADKIRVILPPVVIPLSTAEGRAALRRRAGLDGERVIGFAARFAAEKGAEYLLAAIPHLLSAFPRFKILIAGEYRNVIGEDLYRRLQPRIEQYRDYLAFLGVLSPEEMADFFSICDCLVVASINSTESFGLVQVEAMLNGTPVVATDLPGVRQPVRMTGMGEIVPIRDERALAQAIVRVVRNRPAYVRPPAEVARTFSLDDTVARYERLFAEVCGG